MIFRRAVPAPGPSAGSVALFVLAGFAVSCHRAEAAKPPAPYEVEGETVTLAAATPRPVSFATAKAELGRPLPPPPVTGRVITVETFTSPSFSPLAGHVAEIAVRLGDHVKPGDKLVRIRAQDLSTLHHDLESASLAIKTKQAIYDRTKILVQNHAASENDLLVAESELDEAKLSAASAGAKIESLSVKADDATSFWLVATRAGTIVDLAASAGQEVGPDKEKPVVTVANLDELVVVADVKPRDAKAIAAGGKATIALAGAAGAGIEGTIETVSEVVDPDRQTVPVRIRVPNGDRALMPNAFVDVTFDTAAGSKALLVPSEAVVSDGADAVVFVETEKGKFQKRRVELGRQGKATTEVASGLEPGEAVVTEGALLLLNSLDVEG
jgi:cobalt-zinc-cadmium efflux system membrane fusion protein